MSVSDRLRKIKCTTFKASGKYYSEGEGVLPENWFLRDGDRRDYLVSFNDGRVPGLGSKGETLIVVVEFLEDFDTAVPFLIPARAAP